jgi:hypothetical protein
VLTLSFDRLVMLEGGCDGSLIDRTDDAMVRMPLFGLEPEFPWGIAPVDWDQDGHVDLMIVNGDDQTSTQYERGHRMRPLVYWNAGAWQFEEVGAAMGLDAVRSNYRSVVYDDLDADGDADVLLSGVGVLPRVLRNDIDTGNHGASLRLVGTVSNHLGAGAVVEVVVAGLADQRFVVGDVANVQTQSRPMVFVGAGTTTQLDLVRVTWPSGIVQEVRGLPTGQLHQIVEPAVLTLSEADREVPRDGSFEVRVVPMSVDGQPNPNGVATASVTGAATLIGPTRDGDAWVWTVSGQGQRGTSSVRVEVDGVALRVEPRVTWD